jgi:hypothetical protein
MFLFVLILNSSSSHPQQVFPVCLFVTNQPLRKEGLWEGGGGGYQIVSTKSFKYEPKLA